jgi:TRAP-type C4-dicarboxylate transport system substrate-binding protein
MVINMKKKWIWVILSIFLMFALASCGGGNAGSSGSADNGSSEPGASNSPIVIKLAHTGIDGDQYYDLASRRIKELVEERSGGELLVEIYAGGQLGSEGEQYEAMQTNTLEMGIGITSILASATWSKPTAFRRYTLSALQ